jgi:catechol 2,3-dioxygenase-like lactoylglutathione lyase family enzyme
VLQHVSLEVRPDQVRDCVAFWELLGFTEIEPPPILRDRFTWVERDGTHIHLVPVDDPAVPREGHTAVVAPEGETTVQTLREHGFEPRPGSNAWDAPRWFVTDPAGHRVEVMSAPPVPPWPGEA